ncbi:MAG: carbon starvation protein A [Candidatus Saelkia tenebricola]|nr:carbon starvation protein A [Candidatus Saelkia tenebricola]
MSSVWLFSIAVVCFYLGYRFYLRFLIKKIFPLDVTKITPALEINDGVDYVPAKNWIMLFGHHFASIAGAAPIIGPVIAFSAWGWGVSLVWIVLGSIFIGGVHDFSSLYVSMRSRGCSISEVGKFAVSKKTKYLFSIFILLALILIIAVFLYFCANTFVHKPEIVLPSLGLIPVAILVGCMLYILNFNVFFATGFGLLSMVLLIYFGDIFPIGFIGEKAQNYWIIILMFYCFFASIMPVNILLQPRDYLSSFILFAGIVCAVLGIFITRPKIIAPVFLTFKGEIGLIWPMLFVTIACGAISGFHSLVASGTTSKQISSEAYAPRIGYGSMLLEGVLAVIALISVSVLAMDVFKERLASSGPVGCFEKGYGFITLPLLGGYGESFAVLILNAFILTTLDTATRISRYIMSEIFHFKGRIFPAVFPVILASLLALSGKWRDIWVIFGASNQLIAALSLIVVSGWLLKKKRQIRFTFIPAIFMLLTTISAIIYKLNHFLKAGNIILSIVSIVLILLGVSIIWEARFIFGNKKSLIGEKFG